jgi:hypothetical protein
VGTSYEKAPTGLAVRALNFLATSLGNLLRDAVGLLGALGRVAIKKELSSKNRA